MIKKYFCIVLLILLLTSCKSEKETIDLSKTKNIQFHDLSFNIPEVFEKGDESTGDTEFYEFYTKRKNGLTAVSCQLVFYYNGYYYATNEKIFDFFISKKNHEEYTISNTNINGINWDFAEAKSNTNNGLYYVNGVYVTNNNKNKDKYILFYTDYEPEKQICKEAVKNTIDSLNFNN